MGDRGDPVDVLEGQATTRVPELVPIRYGRMLASPFSFFRGAAAIMAMDLPNTPQSGLQVQACGDAHLSNFGIFAAPDRRPGGRPQRSTGRSAATLARAHARSGDRIAIAAYLGKGEAFDQAIADFSERYADHNELDYGMLADAAKSGRIELETDLV